MSPGPYGNEITWTLGDCSGGPYSDSDTVTEECCLNEGMYTLECIDSFGDGWHGATITIDNTSYCGDFDHGQSQSETVVVGNTLKCACDMFSLHTTLAGKAPQIHSLSVFFE